jgi:hypothetical protein
MLTINMLRGIIDKIEKKASEELKKTPSSL